MRVPCGVAALFAPVQEKLREKAWPSRGRRQRSGEAARRTSRTLVFWGLRSGRSDLPSAPDPYQEPKDSQRNGP